MYNILVYSILKIAKLMIVHVHNTRAQNHFEYHIADSKEVEWVLINILL